MDEPGLEKGDEIWPNLLKTIKDSMISVVIFSKEYAFSKWCLRELAEIMECMEKNSQTVIPVFYNVVVYDVRHQEGSFKDGFDELTKNFYEELAKDKATWTENVNSADVSKWDCRAAQPNQVKSESCMASFDEREKKFLLEMQNWREALKKACNVKGWNSFMTRPDSKLVDKIVKDILKKLMSAYIPSPCDFRGLYGFKERFEKVMSLLCLYNTDIRIIGIWGMGGIGKTTLANFIYHQISDDEYRKCFIHNFRQRLEHCGGLVSVLQQEVLSKVLNDEDIKLDAVTLPQHIKDRLSRKKVFIVLDDVDKFLKLQDLAGGLHQLGPGSRIIITTRNKDIFTNCQVNDDCIYEVKGLSYHEAFQLFCRYAHPTEDCLGFSHEIVQSINGNPLGLKVSSLSLSGSNKQEWGSALSTIMQSSEILEVLRISYNELQKKDKEIFLDIACFFVGEHQDYVEQIFDNCSHSLKVLSNKALITISNNKIIQMHDLLQEMGREIVYEESPNNPGNRSRLWVEEDVLDTLKNDDGSDAIRGIFLNISKMNVQCLSSQAFKKMKNLRFLKLYDSTFDGFRVYSSKVQFPKDLSHLSDKLRSLNWIGYPLKALPSNFIPKNLVELNLRHSNVEKFWEDTMHAPNLKWIILKTCPYLTKVSDLLDAPLLEKINIQNCENLLGFPSPVHHFNNLRKLNMKDCKNLHSFPNNIPFPSLVSLDLSGCINLIRISDLLDASLLETINLQNCKSLLNFPPPVQHFNKLSELNLNSCQKLQSFPSNIQFPSLITLNLYGCINLTRISDLLNAPLLKKLDIQKCKSLLNFPSPVQHFNNLCDLNLQDCKNLQSFPSNNIHFPSLTHLEFLGCINLTKFPHISGNIRCLYMRKTAIDEVPSSIENLSELVELDLAGCKRLKHISVSICKLKALRKLNLRYCSALESFPEILDTMGSLKILDLTGTAIKELHHSIKNLSGLYILHLRECKNLERLPISIYNLTINLSNCSKLGNLPGHSVTLSNCGKSVTTQYPIYRLRKCHVCFTNCLNINKSVVSNIMKLLINQHRDMKVKGYGSQAVNLKFCYPGSEVPGWFKYQTNGSSINIRMSDHDRVNGHLIGLAVCAVIEFDKCTFRSGLDVKYHSHDYNTLVINHITVAYKEETFIDSDHVALWYSDASILQLSRKECVNYLVEFFLTYSYCKVKYCGVCPIYEKHC